MSIFSFIGGLFSSAEALSQDVDEVVPRSSRAGRPQKCGVCGIEGHKAPSHKPGKVYALQLQVADLQEQVAEAESRARAAEDRAEIAEGQVGPLWDRITDLRQLVASLQERLAIAEGYAQVVTYGEGTRI